VALQDTLEQIQNFDLADINWERVGVWPIAGRLFLWVIAVIAIGAGTYFLFIKDLNLTLDRVTLEEQELRKTFSEKAFQSAKLEDYKKQMQEMEVTFGSLVSQLPSETEVPGLLEDIDEKGVESGLDIQSISLQAERAEEFYIELPINISVSGTYHDLGTFISGIAGMPRIVTLHDFNVTGNKNSSKLKMTIQAKTYRYKSDEGG